MLKIRENVVKKNIKHVLSSGTKSRFEGRKTRKMNEQKDLPLSTTRNDQLGGERSSVIKEKTMLFFPKRLKAS